MLFDKYNVYGKILKDLSIHEYPRQLYIFFLEVGSIKLNQYFITDISKIRTDKQSLSTEKCMVITTLTAFQKSTLPMIHLV